MLVPSFFLFICLTLQVHEIEKSVLDHVTTFGLYKSLKKKIMSQHL